MGKILGNINGLERVHDKYGPELVQALRRLEAALQAQSAAQPVIEQSTGLARVSTANPTAEVGLTVVNGSAASAMRSDAAPPLSQGIVPIWTEPHTFMPGDTPSECIILDQTPPAAPGIKLGNIVRFTATTNDGSAHTIDFRLQAVTTDNSSDPGLFVISGRRDGGAYKNLLKLQLASIGGGGSSIFTLGNKDGGETYVEVGDDPAAAAFTIVPKSTQSGNLLEVKNANGDLILTIDATGKLVMDGWVGGPVTLVVSDSSGAGAIQVSTDNLTLGTGVGDIDIGSHAVAHLGVDLDGNTITSVADPVDPQDAATKAWSEAGFVPKVGVLPAGRSGYTSVGGGSVKSDDTWDGGIGGETYTIGDIVFILKNAGLAA